MRKLYHSMLVLMLILCAGCGGAALPSTTSPPVAVSNAIAPTAPMPSTASPPTVAFNAVAPTNDVPEQEPSLSEVAGSLSALGVGPEGLFLPHNPDTLTDTYELSIPISSTFFEAVSSTVTITFSYVGIIYSTSAPSVTLVITAGTTLITTTFKLHQEGQGRVYADFAMFTPANPQNRMNCALTKSGTLEFNLLATHLGMFVNESLWSLYNRYLDQARSTGYISQETYLERQHTLDGPSGALIIDINGIQQELRAFPPRPHIKDYFTQC